jgi:hypothetical protein
MSAHVFHSERQTKACIVQIPVHVGLLSPIVVADLLPDLSSLTSDGEIPIVCAVSQGDELDRIPEVLPESAIAQKGPVLVLAQKLVTAILDRVVPGIV